MAKILIVDDDRAILKLLENILTKDQHTVIPENNPGKVLEMDLKQYELIILDVMMPELDGFSLCQKIREVVDVPILFLIAKTMEDDIMYGLGIGADDYITKPFKMGVFKAKVNAHLRREKREKKNGMTISGVVFDFSGKEIQVNSVPVSFTKTEYTISEHLAKHRGQVFSKKQIYIHVFGYDGESDDSVIPEHIKNIRAKFKKVDIDVIGTVWGVAYKWL